MTMSHALETRPSAGRNLVEIIESTVDGTQEIPALSFMGRLYVRRWIFLACLVLPTMASIGVTLVTPTTWVARTEIMIRYGSSESPFLQKLIPDDRSALSAPVVAEMARSLSTLTETVKRVDLQPEDVYQEPGKAALANIMKLLPFHHHAQEGDEEDKATEVARMLQQSLEESPQSGSNSFGSKTRPVEILTKDSTVPQAMKGDELITLTLRSFNREKVAEIANGLANTLIDVYYRVSAEDAHRSYEFLSSLADRGEAAMSRLAHDPNLPLPQLTADMLEGATNNNAARSSPATAKLQDQLVAAQAELQRTQQFFKSASSRVQREKIEDLKRLLNQQQKLDVGRAALDEVRARRFQAMNTETLYRSRLMPISVIEPAVTPAAAPSSAQVTRLVTSGGVGLAIGAIVGLALVLVFGLLDRRIFTPSDVERVLGLPVVGWLPRFSRKRRGYPNDQRGLDQMRGSLLQTASHLDLLGKGPERLVVAVASPSPRDGKSFVALALARVMAENSGCRVLLIDADAKRASLTRHCEGKAAAGLVEDISPRTTAVADLVERSGYPNIDLLPAHALRQSKTSGFHPSRMRALFQDARRTYDLVIVDTPALSNASEALACCTAAQAVLLVVRSGVSRSPVLKSLLRKLQDVTVRPVGVILNCRYGSLPRLLDQDM